MEDTLRYFFSAVFQGFAAVLTLGAMFFLYHFQLIDFKKRNIKDQMMDAVIEWHHFIRKDVYELGVYKFIKDRVLKKEKLEKSYIDTYEMLINNYDEVVNKEAEVKKLIPPILNQSIVILLMSLVSLFLVGSHMVIKFILVVVGVFIIILAFCYFKGLTKLIKTILEL